MNIGMDGAMNNDGFGLGDLPEVEGNLFVLIFFHGAKRIKLKVSFNVCNKMEQIFPSKI